MAPKYGAGRRLCTCLRFFKTGLILPHSEQVENNAAIGTASSNQYGNDDKY